MPNSKTTQNGSLLVFTLVGGSVALLLFLGTFILSSRANVPNPKSSLRIPVPSVPILPTPSPLQKALQLIPQSSASATPAATSETVIEATPIESPTTNN